MGGANVKYSMSMRVIVFAIAGALISLIGASLMPAVGQTPSQDTASPISVNIGGFRSAKFGMTEEEVRKAIRRDFQLENADATSVPNPTEKTIAITAKVKEIIQGSGTSQVAYILGMTSKKLIQINIAFGEPVDKNVLMPSLLTLANALRQYFLEQGEYAKDTVQINQQLKDGSILIFRGGDTHGRTILLRLMPQKENNAADAKNDVVGVRGTLLLSYIENSVKPDVFRIKKGSF